MKIPKIANEMGQIDDDLITAAAAPARTAKRPFIKWAILAASMGAVILVSALVISLLLGEESPSDITPPYVQPPVGQTVSLGDLDRNYNDLSINPAETAIEWPEEYLTAYEKHSNITWKLRSYITSGVMLYGEHLGEKIGNYRGFEIYSIQDMPEEFAIAVGIEGDWFVYRCKAAFDKQPATLGELFDYYDLAHALKLSHFTKVENKYTEAGYYALNDDDYIVDVLASCRDAAALERGDLWERSEEYLSFTLTSDRLGVYARAMYITADGYLWTNAFDYAYVYEIGEDAAGKIISYALENATERATFEPYEYRLAGTVTEIKDGYVYVDDSILCVDPAEGMVFRLSLADIRIRRCIEYAGIGVGDVVVVTFRGGVDIENGNLITGATGMTTGTLVEGDVIVPE